MSNSLPSARPPSNPYEQRGREEKARHLADLLAAWGYFSFHCAGWGEDQWRMATDAANALERKRGSSRKHSLPSDETRSLVIKMLRDRELLEVPQHA